MGVADFDIGAQVFDTTLVQHITANLVTPSHIGFGVFQFLLRFHALAHLKIVQARAQTFPSHITVAVLASTVLALNHNTRGYMCQAHGRVGLVDVLSTCAAGTKRIGSDVGWVDVDLNRIINLRIDKNTGKTGVTPACRVKG